MNTDEDFCFNASIHIREVGLTCEIVWRETIHFLFCWIGFMDQLKWKRADPNSTAQRRSLCLFESFSMVHWYRPCRTNPISNSLLDSGSWVPREALHSCSPLLSTRLADRAGNSRLGAFTLQREPQGVCWYKDRVLSLKDEGKGPRLRRSRSLPTLCLQQLAKLFKGGRRFSHLPHVPIHGGWWRSPTEHDLLCVNSSCMLFILEVRSLLQHTLDSL